MEKLKKLSGITAELIGQAQNLQRIVTELSKLMGEYSCRNMDIPNDVPADMPPNIIAFPGAGFGRDIKPIGTNDNALNASFPAGRLPAMPGRSLPDGLMDYRPFLQRNGLILLSWDKRITEMGERYAAYWVTSAGPPRFYASKYLPLEDFPSARPDHKSYAAEDGIEFYGQEAPQYVMHVAPELMMNNPRHGELRAAHIQTLQEQGSSVDFSYKYLLKTEKEKNRKRSCNSEKETKQHQAG